MSIEDGHLIQQRRRLLTLGGIAATGALAYGGLSSSARASVTAQPDLTGLVSVKDYGADNTGVMDSTAAIQSAIDNAYVMQNGEAMVVFPPGKYKISDAISIVGKKNISLLGLRASIVQTGAGKDFIRLVNTDHCSIQDMYLTCDHAISGNGIYLDGSRRTTLVNVEIYGVGGHCLWADKSFWLSARDCVFSNPGYGKFAVFHKSTMHSVAYHHCYFSGGMSPGGGGCCHEGGTAVSFFSCDFSNNSVGMFFRGGMNFVLSNCYFEKNVVGVQWGENTSNAWWAISGTIDNCYFNGKDIEVGRGLIHIDIQRGTNLRINNPFMIGNGSYDPPATGDAIGIRVNNQCLPSDNRQIVIDDSPYMELMANRIVDPGKRLQRIVTQAYCDSVPSQCSNPV